MGLVECRQVVERGSGGRVVRAELMPTQPQGFLGIGFGLRVAALLVRRCDCCKPPSTRPTAQRPCRDHESPTRRWRQGRERQGRESCVAHAWVSAFRRSASKPTGQDSVSDFDDGDELRGPSINGSSGSTTAYKHPLILRPHLRVGRKKSGAKRTLLLEGRLSGAGRSHRVFLRQNLKLRHDPRRLGVASTSPLC